MPEEPMMEIDVSEPMNEAFLAGVKQTVAFYADLADDGYLAICDLQTSRRYLERWEPPSTGLGLCPVCMRMYSTCDDLCPLRSYRAPASE